MVKYLLDTDHAIDLVRGDSILEQWILEEGIDAFAISEITLAEMSVYAAKSGLEKHRRQVAFLEKHFTILPFCAHVEYGAIRAAMERHGKRLDDMDILIAATAVRESVTLLTENNRHFSRIPNLKTENWRYN